MKQIKYLQKWSCVLLNFKQQPGTSVFSHHLFNDFYCEGSSHSYISKRLSLEINILIKYKFMLKFRWNSSHNIM